MTCKVNMNFKDGSKMHMMYVILKLAKAVFEPPIQRYGVLYVKREAGLLGGGARHKMRLKQNTSERSTFMVSRPELD